MIVYFSSVPTVPLGSSAPPAWNAFRVVYSLPSHRLHILHVATALKSLLKSFMVTSSLNSIMFRFLHEASDTLAPIFPTLLFYFPFPNLMTIYMQLFPHLSHAFCLRIWLPHFLTRKPFYPSLPVNILQCPTYMCSSMKLSSTPSV